MPDKIASDMVQRAGPIAIALFLLSAAASGAELRLEYRKNAAGVPTAVFINRRSAPVTAYLAEASFDQSGRERHVALGGDTLGFSNGEDRPFPPMRDTDSGRPLPGNATASVTRILAAIYADGFTEGEDEAVAMLLSGRHRALLDLDEALKVVADSSRGDAKLTEVFSGMAERDNKESAVLDDMQDSPGRMRYRYFLSAVPNAATEMLQHGADRAALTARLEEWRNRLRASKPDVK